MSRPSRSELIAGHPVLDLVNTVSWRGDPTRRIERIPDFDALLAWSARAGLINAAELGRLAAAARRAPGRGAQALADTRRLRERLHQALTSTEARRQEAIQLMWPQLTAALRHVRPEGLPPQLTIELREPNDLTRRLALLALQFLTSEDVRLASACADRDCGWVFLDRSRNRTRRWCSSGDCGNRNRVRQYNARHALRATLHDDHRSQRSSFLPGCGNGSIPTPTRSSSSCLWPGASGWSGTASTTSSPNLRSRMSASWWSTRLRPPQLLSLFVCAWPLRRRVLASLSFVGGEPVFGGVTHSGRAAAAMVTATSARSRADNQSPPI